MRELLALTLVALLLFLAPAMISVYAVTSQNASQMQVESSTIFVTAGTTTTGSFPIANIGNSDWTISRISAVSYDPSLNCTIVPLSYYPYVTYISPKQSVRIEVSVAADKSASFGNHPISIVFTAKRGLPLSQGPQQSFSGNISIYVTAPTYFSYMPVFQFGFIIAECLVAYLIVFMFIRRQGGWFSTRTQPKKMHIPRPHFYREMVMNSGVVACRSFKHSMKKSCSELRQFGRNGVRLTKNLISKIR